LKGPFLNPPNLISLARVPLGAAACLFVALRLTVAASAMIFLAIISDFVDGYAARKLGMVSDWGKILDPLADKVALGAFVLTLTLLGLLPLWFVIAFLLRDLLIASGGIYLTRRLGSPPSSNMLGKLTSCFMSLYLTEVALGYMLNAELVPSSPSFAGLNILGIVAFAFVLISFFAYFSESVSKLRKCSS